MANCPTTFIIDRVGFASTRPLAGVRRLGGSSESSTFRAVPLHIAALTVITLTAFLGCSTRQEPAFSTGKEVDLLPESHQAQIRDGLALLFGTPARPHLRMPDADQPEEEEVKLIDAIDPNRLRRGAEIYNVRCAGCHGIGGDGKGPAAEYLQPKPRDYRQGVFKFTSTPYGAKPTRSDLIRTIRRGAKGTSMPAFPWMPEDDLEAVIDYVLLLGQRGEVERLTAIIAEMDYGEDEEIEQIDFLDNLVEIREMWSEAAAEVVDPVTPRPPYNTESILAGRAAFISEGCSKCHGEDATGQTDWLSHEFIAAQEALPEGERADLNRDAWGEIAPAADLTARMLHGGRRPIDIYRRIYTGINGTPMPSFAQSFANDPDKTWHLVHYVLSIVEGGDVVPEESDSN